GPCIWASRLSSALTEYPCSRNSVAQCEPIKPAPPVIRTVLDIGPPELDLNRPANAVPPRRFKRVAERKIADGTTTAVPPTANIIYVNFKIGSAKKALRLSSGPVLAPSALSFKGIYWLPIPV